MPRTSTSRPAPVAYKPAPPPAVYKPAPLPAPSFGQTIKEGFGFGFGNAIAQRVATSIFGAPKIQTERVPTAYEQCIAEHRDDAALCAHLAQTK
jgi:hypothetical protein